MEVFILTSLFIYWAIFWSFSSVLINRWKYHKKGIIAGRSECPNCHHTLGYTELIPIVSYIFQWGKCKHCHTRISKIYPTIEITMGIIFVCMGIITKQLTWSIIDPILWWLLFFSFITIVYVFYDILFTEIPDEIFIIFIVWYFILFILSYFFSLDSIFFNATTAVSNKEFFKDKFLWAFILYTFLYLQILIPWIVYYIQKNNYSNQKKWKDIGELFLFFISFPLYVIADVYKKYFWNHTRDIQDPGDWDDEIPTWVWAWDLIIAIMIGMILGVKYGFISFFIAYIIGSIFWVGIIIKNIFDKSDAWVASTWRGTEIPFWPFLAAGFFLVILLKEYIDTIISTIFWYTY